MPISWIAVQQRRVGEEAARRHPEMLAERVAEPSLRAAVAREAHVDAPQQERQPLAEMADDEFEPRMRVETPLRISRMPCVAVSTVNPQAARRMLGKRST